MSGITQGNQAPIHQIAGVQLPVQLAQQNAPQRVVGNNPGIQNPVQARVQGQQQINQGVPERNLLKSVGVGFTAALRILAAVGSLGISEGLIRGIRSAVRSHGMQSPRGMQVQVTLTNGINVNVPTSMLPKRIPQGMTAQALSQLIQQKAANGSQLLQQLTNGQIPNRACSIEDMSDIMWCLQLTAEAKGEGFVEGAITIEDPGQNIRRFLDTCPESYQRASSHVDDFQKLQGGAHRGIDVHGKGHDLDKSLPNHRKTLLYGSLGADPNLNMSRDRLYVKMESYGAFLCNPKYGIEANGPYRVANLRDGGAMLGHSFSFIATRGQGSAGGSRKERIPDAIKNQFKQLTSRCNDIEKIVLNDNNPLSTGGGIKTMLANIRTLQYNLAPNHPLQGALANFDAMVSNLYPNGTQDRIGNEVMLNRNDL